MIEWLIELFNIETYSSVTITAVATCILAIATFGTMIAIISVGWFQLRRLRREALIREVRELLKTWSTSEMVESRYIVGDIIVKGKFSLIAVNEEEFKRSQSYLRDKMFELQKSGDKKFFQILQIFDYFEALGYMMKSKDSRILVKELVGDNIIAYYERFQKWIEKMQKPYPEMYIYWKELYKYCHEEN